MRKSLFFFLTISLFFLNSNCYGQYIPYFQNYSLTQYSAGNQNWGISKASDGKLYVANHRGLLVFNGINWKLYQLPNKTTIRSVYAYKDVVYTGSYEEFGFWKKDRKGVLTYTSLTNNLDRNFLNEEIWQISSFGGAIVFRSFLNVYVFKNNEIIKIKPTSTVISTDVVGDNFYVSTLKDGIFLLKGTQLIPFLANKQLINTKVISINQFNKNLLITTALNGCFIFDGKKLKPWNTNVNDFLKAYQLNSYSQVNSNLHVFGTIQNGLYFADYNGTILYHLNKENGLANNTTLYQYLDKSRLWVGLDNGLASVEVLSDHFFYKDYSGKLGAVYDVVSYNGVTFIGSNTGLYYLDETNKIQFIEGSQGQVWDLKVIEGELFCGHNNGTYVIKNKEFIQISPYTGGWVIKKVPGKDNLYVQGTYAGLVKFHKENDSWVSTHLGKTTSPLKFMVFQDTHTAWATHASKGVFRVNFNRNYDSILDVVDYKNKGLISDFNTRVYKIKNEICFKANDGWYRYEPILDSIVSYDLLNEKFGRDAYVISESDADILAFKNHKFVYFTSLSDFKEQSIIPQKYINNKLIIGHENISKLSNNKMVLNLNDGFMVLGTNGNRDPIEVYPPVLESVKVNDYFLDLDSIEDASIPYQNQVAIALSSSNSKDFYFEYSVGNNSVDVWNKIEGDSLKLTNIGYGQQKINLRTSHNLGNKSEVLAVTLNVLSPWYKGISGFLFYIVLVFILSLLFFYLHKRKIAKEQRLIKLKHDLEQKALIKEQTAENTKKIIQLKNDSLERELKLKSKQLANTAMAIIKKNESMLGIKAELIQNKNNFENLYAYKKLLKKIDSSIGHEDEWQVFEYNFNQVHAEFFDSLSKEFPNLSRKDLKICAYIKMNLTSKEIAPLMNISVRGVETIRYRLKKKMNLDNDNSLVDFLLNYNK